MYFQKVQCGIANTDRALLLKAFPLWIIKAVFEIGLSKGHSVGCTQTTYVFAYTYKHTK